jgi:tetratricopeptide (TPR) repeat protein
MKGKPQVQNDAPRRNDSCPCGSGRKYKHCCADKDRALGLQDQFVRDHVRRGQSLEAQGHTEEALQAYRVAIAFGRAPEAHSRIGHILMNRGEVGAASLAFRSAAADDDRVERRLDLVRALIIEGRGEEAEAEVRRVVALDPRSHDGFWLLGRILSEAGRFAEARDALERAVALEPRQGSVYYDLVRSFRVAEADRRLVERMAAIAPALVDADQRIRMHFALGKAFDDLREFGAAMRHFEEANRIKDSVVSFNRTGFERRIDRLIERFTPEFIAAHVENGDSSELPILIVGMPRSGTTLVEQILSSHDAVAGGGEMQFWARRGPSFDEVKDKASIADFQRRAAKDCLAALCGFAPGAARVVDKNPLNFLWAGTIHLALPRAVIIHCRRDPIDTCLSIFSTYFRPQADFSTSGEDLAFYYRRYRRLMAHWRATLPPARFVEVDYEALVAHPEAESRRLIAACGLEWSPKCLRPQDNARVIRSASKWQARQPIHAGAVGRWRRYEPWIGAFRELAAGADPLAVA